MTSFLLTYPATWCHVGRDRTAMFVGRETSGGIAFYNQEGHGHWVCVPIGPPHEGLFEGYSPVVYRDHNTRSAP